MPSLSVLQKARQSDVHLDPFPYLVIRDALPADLCERLIASYPALPAMDVNLARNNARWSYPTHKVAQNQAIDPLWRDFVAYHASKEFFHEIVDLFYDGIRAAYPGRFSSIQSLKDMSVGVRDKDARETTDILMDAQISGNTPVRTPSSVRTIHIDAGDKLFSGLFYLRRDDDDSVGGDLSIYKFKPRYRTLSEKLSCFNGVNVDDRFLDKVDEVKYAKNVLVLFINSIDSLHGVSVRQETKHPRIFLNLVGEVDDLLYQVPKRWQMLPQIVKRSLRDRISVDA